MRKGKTLLGKDILSLATGEKLHSVKGVVIGDDSDDIVALVVDEGGLLGTTRVVPIEAVESFGKDAVVITDSAAIGPASAHPRVKEILDRKDRLVGKKVFTEAGKEKGSVNDLYFDEETGRILGLEISTGVVGNLTSGTSFLAIEQIVRTGPDIVYIVPEAVDALDSQVGGLRGAMDEAKQKAGDAAASLSNDVNESNAAERLVGRRSGADVTDENGSIVVANGQRITPEHVERAKATGNLTVLTESVLAAEGQAPGQGGAAAGEQLADAAGSAWDQFTRKIQELTDASGKRMDERQTKQRLQEIEDAVGRPVTKVVLDRQDNVILNLGDIITHQSIQQAYDAGALDSLLSSVYKAEVTFERDEMRAPVEGAATVDKATGDAPIVDELQSKVEQAQAEREQEQQAKREQAEADRQKREEERQARAEQRDAQTQGAEVAVQDER
jgi:uncharacterized protein YrrD